MEDDELDFSIRSVNPAKDAEALLDFLKRYYAEEKTTFDMTVEQLKEQLRASGDRDRLIAVLDTPTGDFAGFAINMMQTPERAVPKVIVLKQYRRNGIGSELMFTILDRAVKRGAKHATYAVNEKDIDGNRFLASMGFEAVAFEWAFGAMFASLPPVPDWPLGFSVLAYAKINDPELLLSVMNGSRADMWGHSENTPGAMNREKLDSVLKYWGEENIFIIFSPDKRGIGIFSTHASDNPNSPESAHIIDAPTIIPEFRDAGLHLPAVQTALRHLYGGEPGYFRLESFGDDEKRVEWYEKAGFELLTKSVAYRKNL